MNTLYVRDGDEYREADAEDVFACAQAFMARRFRRGAPVLNAPAQTREFLRMHLGNRDCEMFGIIHVNTRQRLIHVQDLFPGTIDGAVVHPREVVKAALARNAAGVICYHNHPSGVAEPSQADELITRRLREALALVDIRLLDHLIVGETIYSFAEAGRL
jgi:DNA repair protein RadC